MKKYNKIVMAKATGASVKINENIYTNGILHQQKKNCKEICSTTLYMYAIVSCVVSQYELSELKVQFNYHGHVETVIVSLIPSGLFSSFSCFLHSE